MTPQLEGIVREFAESPPELRLELLLGYSEEVSPLPPELANHPERLERVHECQTPFFLATHIDAAGVVTLHFDAPQEAPTTRGFAGVLGAGLAGATALEVLDTPNDFYLRMGLAPVISPLRLRGMSAILARIKRQVSEATVVNHPA
jgi:cysteine desulfuration protein SufE